MPPGRFRAVSPVSCSSPAGLPEAAFRWSAGGAEPVKLLGRAPRLPASVPRIFASDLGVSTGDRGRDIRATDHHHAV